MEDGSDCIQLFHSIPLYLMLVPVVRAIGSVSHNFDNLHITTCFVTCVCSTGCVVAAPRHCLSITHDDCGSYHLPCSAQTAAIPCDNCLRLNCMFQHLTSFKTELQTLEGERLQPHNTDLFLTLMSKKKD
jgi:hypothetical protein